MSTHSIPLPTPQVQSLDLFPSRSEEWLMMNQPEVASSNITPRIDVALLQPAISVENINLIATTGPLRRTISVVPSTPEDWANHIHLDLSHESNADLVNRRKRTSSF